MHPSRRRATLVCSSLLAAGILAGVAVAGNPHGSSDNSSGVKPSSTTQHDTHASAGSNKTKLYGNGKTAGQVAMHNGASSSTDLYGPGNSQPHKVAVCSRNGKSHDVDVHALKAHRGGSCSTNAAAPAVASGSTQAQTQGQAQASRQTSTHSGVLGASHTQTKPVTGGAKPAHAVLGAASFTG